MLCWPGEDCHFGQCLGSFLIPLNACCRPHNVLQKFPFLPCGPSLLATQVYVAAHCSMAMLRSPVRMHLPRINWKQKKI